MKSKNIFLIVMLTLFFIEANSQNCSYTFTGVVEDFHDKSTIVGATIYIKSLNKYTTTDVEGKFSINGLCSGKVTVQISHIACETKTLTVEISKNVFKIFNLEHHIEELDEVNVKGNVLKKTKTSQETLLKTKTLENFSDASLGDAIKEVSGVSSINTGNNIVKPVINGLHSSRILTSINGVRLQDQDWGIEHAPNIDINAAGSISVIKGANALEYGGDAIGGVIIINPARTIKKDTLQGKFIISQQTNGRLSSFSTSLNKTYETGWFVNGQTSFRRAGDFEAANYNLTNTGLKTYGFSTNGGFKGFDKGFDIYYSYLSNEIGILRSSHIGNSADLVNAINNGEPLVVNEFSYDINNPKQEVKHQLVKAKLYKRLKGLGVFSLQYDFQHNNRLEFDIRRGNRNSLPATDLTLKNHAVKADMKFDANSNTTYKIGISGGYQNNFPDPRTRVRRLIPDYDKYNAGIYAISEFRFNGFLLSTGLRYDYNHIDSKKRYLKTRWNSLNYNQDFSDIIINEDSDEFLTNPKFNYHNLSASAGLLIDLNSENSILLNYGLSSRAPNPSELFSDGLHHSASRIELGNLRIQPEKSHRLSSTYTYVNDKVNFSIEGFYNFINDFIYMEPTATENTIRGSFVVWSHIQTDANLFGVDTTIKYQFSDNFSISNKSSLLKGIDVTRNRPLIDIPPFKTVSTLQFIKPEWNNFQTTLQSKFNARQNEFPNNNFTTFVAISGQDELVDISTPPNAFHLLNFTSGVDLNLFKTKIGLQFSVDNIFNTSYRNYLNRLRFYADEIGRNFKIQIKINY